MISIITPLYNAEKYIQNTIDTVCNQTYTDWELILVDDCSKDNSVVVAKNAISYLPSELQSKIRLIEKKVNEGAAKARNTGLDNAAGRYIAFLDADDVWYPNKLEHELSFMEKHEAGFVFTSYQFGDEEAIPTGKVVRVPQKLSYKKALSRTIIFTSTVLLDTEKIDKSLMYMPSIGSEDSATWWKIMKTGVIAYGLDEQLAIYRRPPVSLSSNKGKAIQRIWTLYREAEQLDPVSAGWHLLLWAFNATSRRIMDDGVRSHLEAIKRFTVLQLSLLGLVLYTLIYAYAWFKVYYPIVSAQRISQEGFYIGTGMKLYFRGHLLVLLIFFLVLWFISQNNGSMRLGYQKASQMWGSQVMALALTNIVTYAQISLMKNWIVTPWPLLLCFVAQSALAVMWMTAANSIFKAVFAPRETLIIYGDDKSDGLDKLTEKLDRLEDRFKVMKNMPLSNGISKIEDECVRWYGCVALFGVYGEERKKLVEFCYAHYIRVFIIPDIHDLLIRGFDKMDLCDTPILELKEYSISWEIRMIKRLLDIVISALALVILSPLIIVVYIKNCIRGYRTIRKDICISRDNKTFNRLSFGDDGFGWSLPMLINVLKGDMSLVGPEAVSIELDGKLRSIDNRFDYRHRVKAGFTGYATAYGKTFHMYGDSITDDEAMNILKLDLVYIQEYSIMLDVRLLTGALMIGRKYK